MTTQEYDWYGKAVLGPFYECGHSAAQEAAILHRLKTFTEMEEQMDSQY